MICPTCQGKKYREYEHGLIRLPCVECGGTGEITDLLLHRTEFPLEEIDGTKGTGQLDIKPKKRKRKPKKT